MTTEPGKLAPHTELYANIRAVLLTAQTHVRQAVTNLKLFRQFYLAFPISHTLCDQSDGMENT